MTPVSNNTQNQWLVVDHDRNNQRMANTRNAAETMQETAQDLGSNNVEILDPGETSGDAKVENEVVDTKVVEPTPEPATPTTEDGYDLPERSVSDDPITWMPGDFIDQIDGTPAINRKGFEVLSHFYDISVLSDLEVPPEDTDHEYCRVKATATMPDGRSCEAYGSAHTERGDDAVLLLEMADTRARKRALSIATGVGAVAVEELKNEVDA